jgi:hypothetical protein
MLQVSWVISLTIQHLAIFSKLIHCITACKATSTMARNWRDIVATSSATTSFRFTSWSSSTFRIIQVFMLLPLDFDVLHIIQVFNTHSSGHSHPNEFHVTCKRKQWPIEPSKWWNVICVDINCGRIYFGFVLLNCDVLILTVICVDVMCIDMLVR